MDCSAFSDEASFRMRIPCEFLSDEASLGRRVFSKLVNARIGKAVMSKEKTAKVRSLALDNVPFWTQEETDEFRKTKKAPLPEGVTNKGIYKDILAIAWPSMIELALTQLASMVDLMMVGQIHYNAVTAVDLPRSPSSS